MDAANPVSHLVYTFECASMRIAFASVDGPIERLSTHYHPKGTLLGPQECLDEWSSFRQFLQGASQLKRHGEVVHYLTTDGKNFRVIPTYHGKFFGCVIPIHSTDVERTFTQIKLTKTSVRYRMI